MADLPLRREPPEFHLAQVAAREQLTPRLTVLTLQGSGLVGFQPDGPAASLRLLLPRAGSGALELPAWNGNEFLYDDGARPPIRTLTPMAVEPGAGRLQVAVVRHGEGPLSAWADSVQVGDEVQEGDQVAVSGPGRGYEVDPDATSFLLAGDESALPAILTVLAELPAGATARVLVEVAGEADRLELPSPATVSAEWIERRAGADPGGGLADALRDEPIEQDTPVWVAGEAAAVQRIRKLLFDERGLTRSQAVIRGYWKLGRAGAGS